MRGGRELRKAVAQPRAHTWLEGSVVTGGKQVMREGRQV